jgi:hypothetical protein
MAAHLHDFGVTGGHYLDYALHHRGTRALPKSGKSHESKNKDYYAKLVTESAEQCI